MLAWIKKFKRWYALFMLFFLPLACCANTDSLETAQLLINAMLLSMHPGYKVHHNTVYFKSCNAGNGCTMIKIKGADPKTFQVVLKYEYGKDAHHVYYQEEVIQGADPVSFKVFPGGIWSIDKNHVYNYGNLVDGADAKSFRPLNAREAYSLGADKSHLIIGTKVYPACDPKTLHQVKGSADFQADSKCFYDDGHIVRGADRQNLQAEAGLAAAARAHGDNIYISN